MNLNIGDKVTRSGTFSTRVNERSRMMEASISSEEPVPRPWGGNEIMLHGPENIDLSRAIDGTLPLLYNHDPDRHIGRVGNFSLNGGKLRCTMNLGTSPFAEEIFQGVKDGTIRECSIGYEILEAQESGLDIIITRAKLYEASLVSIPADVTVGINRSLDSGDTALRIRAMCNDHPGLLDDLAKQAIRQKWNLDRFERVARQRIDAPVEERERILDIIEATEQSGLENWADLAGRAIVHSWDDQRLKKEIGFHLDQKDKREAQAYDYLRDGTPRTDFERSIYQKAIADLRDREGKRGPELLQLIDRAEAEVWPINRIFKGILELLSKQQQTIITPAAEHGMRRSAPMNFTNNFYRTPDTLEGAMNDYSVLRLLRGAATGDFREAGLEVEVSRELERSFGKRTDKLLIPWQAMNIRGLTKGTAADGGYTVGTDHLGGMFIEPLRALSLVVKLGAQVLTGLQGDVAIPKQTGAATGSWVAEGAAISEGTQTFGSVTMTPKTVGGLTRVSRKLLLQSDPAIENIVRRDLLAVVTGAIDAAAINGSGSGSTPRGILSTSGIGSVAGGDNGLAPAWSHVVDLMTEVGQDNALTGNLGYLTNSKVVGKLMKTMRTATYGEIPIIENLPDSEGFTNLAGARCAVSNNVPSTLVKGSSGAVCSAIVYGDWTSLLIGMWGPLQVDVDPSKYFEYGDSRIRVMQDCDIAVRHAESFAAMQDALTT